MEPLMGNLIAKAIQQFLCGFFGSTGDLFKTGCSLLGSAQHLHDVQPDPAKRADAHDDRELRCADQDSSR